jgi:hypothetical protein
MPESPVPDTRHLTLDTHPAPSTRRALVPAQVSARRRLPHDREQRTSDAYGGYVPDTWACSDTWQRVRLWSCQVSGVGHGKRVQS